MRAKTRLSAAAVANGAHTDSADAQREPDFIRGFRAVLTQPTDNGVLREAIRILGQALKPGSIRVVRFALPTDTPRIVARWGSTRQADQLLRDGNLMPLLRQALRRRSPLMLSELNHQTVLPARKKRRGITRGMMVRIDGLHRPFGAFTITARTGGQFLEKDRRLAWAIGDLVSLALRELERNASALQAERRFRRVVEGNPDILYLATIAPEIAVQYLSPAVQNLTGYRAEEFYNDPALVVQMIDPDDMLTIRADVERPDRIRGTTLLRLIGHDGRRIWVSASRTPIHNESGQIIAVQGTIRDVTGKVADRQALIAGLEAGEALVQGRRLEVAINVILRHLHYVVDAEESVVVAENGRSGRLRVVSRIASSQAARPALAPKTELLVRRAMRARQPIVRPGAVAAVIPWSSERGGVLIVRGLRGDDLYLGRLASSIDAFARMIGTMVQWTRHYRDRFQRGLDEDRARIARELHDGVVQTLFAVAFQLQLHVESLSDPVKSSLTQASAGVREAIQDIQQYVFDLEPSLLMQGGLEPSMRQLALDFQATSGVSVTIATEPDAVAALEPTATHMLQIAREALSNVRRHAQADHVALTIRRVPSGALLEIRDDGQGFSPEAAQGLGVRNLRTRARLLGGKLELHSEPGKGSVVRVLVPPTKSQLPPVAVSLPA